MTKTSDFPEDFEADFKGTWESAFSKIVKPDKICSWESESKSWFVLEQTHTAKRKPGNIIFF